MRRDTTTHVQLLYDITVYLKIKIKHYINAIVSVHIGSKLFCVFLLKTK